MVNIVLEDVISEIIRWVGDNSDHSINSIQPDTELMAESIFDSMQILEFVSWLEGRFQITVGVDKMTPDFFKSPKIIAEQVIQLQI